MKRLISAGILLVLVAVLAITGQRIIIGSMNEYADRIKACRSAYSTDDNSKALKLAKELETDWEKNERLFSAFMNHESVNEIGRSVARLRSYAASDRIADFYCECDVALILLKQEREEHSVTFGSML